MVPIDFYSTYSIIYSIILLVLLLHCAVVFMVSEDEQMFKLVTGHFLPVSSVNVLANTA